jgi:viroplasmin and RNaseH domain-containing protein
MAEINTNTNTTDNTDDNAIVNCNTIVNANTNTNTNTNTNIDDNAIVNANEIVDANANTNANHNDYQSKPPTYYAICHGKHVNNGIFLSWEDAKHHIIDYEEAKYSTFDNIQDALQYLTPLVNVGNNNNNNNPASNIGATSTTNNNEFDSGNCNGNGNVSALTSAKASSEPQSITIATIPIPVPSPDHNPIQDLTQQEKQTKFDNKYTTTTTRKKVSLPKETETVEVDGRTIHKRRPSKNWMSMYKRLQEYRKKTGSFYITATDKENIPLKRWISEQKHQFKCFKTGKKHFSSQMKRQLLMDIGFDFEFHSFHERLEQLKKFKLENGTTNVPIDDPLLGTWMETQRRQLLLFNKGKESKLNNEKVQQLRDVGVDVVNVDKPYVRPRQETSSSLKKWEEMFANLKEYKNATNHCQVPRSDTENQALYKWVCQQRLEYKKLRNDQGNKMTASRLQKLNDIGFVFNPRSVYLRWDERMDQLREYKEKHCHLRVPVTDPELGEFVARQRVEYAKLADGKPSNMNDERARDLTELGFVFQVGKRRLTEMKVVRKTWDERFRELLDFKEMYGHTLVPQNNSALGEWVHKQRKMYKLLKNGKPCALTTERALKLADVGFIFDASGYRRGRKMIEEPMAMVPMPIVQVPTVPDPYEHIQNMNGI